MTKIGRREDQKWKVRPSRQSPIALSPEICPTELGRSKMRREGARGKNGKSDPSPNNSIQLCPHCPLYSFLCRNDQHNHKGAPSPLQSILERTHDCNSKTHVDALAGWVQVAFWFTRRIPSWTGWMLQRFIFFLEFDIPGEIKRKLGEVRTRKKGPAPNAKSQCHTILRHQHRSRTHTG